MGAVGLNGNLDGEGEEGEKKERKGFIKERERGGVNYTGYEESNHDSLAVQQRWRSHGNHF